MAERRRLTSNAKLILQLCAKLKSDLEFLKELIGEVVDKVERDRTKLHLGFLKELLSDVIDKAEQERVMVELSTRSLQRQFGMFDYTVYKKCRDEAGDYDEVD
jgi:hypothetical protein